MGLSMKYNTYKLDMNYIFVRHHAFTKKIRRDSLKNILCFGDSNTYGYKPDGSGRYDFDQRWPGRLELLLGDGYHVIEEGLPGRTTVFGEAAQPHRKGSDYIVPCLLSQLPLDFVIVMLGTNDCKAVFGAGSEEVAAGLKIIVRKIIALTTGETRILIVSPIHLGDNIAKPGYDPEFDERSRLSSIGLAAEYRKLAEEKGLDFLDASEFAQASPIDEEHLDAEGHAALAGAVAEIIKRCADERI